MIKSFFGFLLDIVLAILGAFVIEFILGLFGVYIPFYILFIMCFVCKKFGSK